MCIIASSLPVFPGAKTLDQLARKGRCRLSWCFHEHSDLSAQHDRQRRQLGGRPPLSLLSQPPAIFARGLAGHGLDEQRRRNVLPVQCCLARRAAGAQQIVGRKPQRARERRSLWRPERKDGSRPRERLGHGHGHEQAVAMRLYGLYTPRRHTTVCHTNTVSSFIITDHTRHQLLLLLLHLLRRPRRRPAAIGSKNARRRRRRRSGRTRYSRRGAEMVNLLEARGRTFVSL